MICPRSSCPPSSLLCAHPAQWGRPRGTTLQALQLGLLLAERLSNGRPGLRREEQAVRARLGAPTAPPAPHRGHMGTGCQTLLPGSCSFGDTAREERQLSRELGSHRLRKPLQLEAVLQGAAGTRLPVWTPGPKNGEMWIAFCVIYNNNLKNGNNPKNQKRENS